MSPRERLELFRRREAELSNTRLVRSRYNLSLNIKYDETSGLQLSMTPPDEDDWRSFLLTFRQFISQDEPVFVPSTYNLCHQIITDDVVKQNLAASRQRWRTAFQHGGLPLTINNEALTSEHLLDLWINGHYFHNDADKLRELEALVPPNRIHTPIVMAFFINAVVEATKEIYYISDAIEYVLDNGLVNI